MVHTSSAGRVGLALPSPTLLSHLCYNESARILPRRQKHRLTFVCSLAPSPVRPLLRTLLLQASSRELAWCENNGSPSHLPSLPPDIPPSSSSLPDFPHARPLPLALPSSPFLLFNLCNWMKMYSASNHGRSSVRLRRRRQQDSVAWREGEPTHAIC